MGLEPTSLTCKSQSPRQLDDAAIHGGGDWIRTSDPAYTGLAAYKAAPFDRSGTPPCFFGGDFS